MGQDGYKEMAQKLMNTANKMKAGINKVDVSPRIELLVLRNKQA